MKITVIVKPNKKENKISKIGENAFEIWTKEPAKENKANEDVINQLSDYLNIPKNKISLVLGKTSKTKLFVID